MSVESEVGALKEKTETHGQALRDIWKILQETNTTASKLDLILYRLDEQARALASHDAAETDRHNAHETRIKNLEDSRAEHKGAWKIIAAQAAGVGALVSALIVAIAEHLLSVKP